MTSPRDAIEAIACSADRSLAITFFLFFARFEYSLKRTGYVSVGADAKADWTVFAQVHADVLSSNSETCFVSAVKLIKESPPKKQKVEDGRLVWESDSFNQAFDAGRLLTLVCRIRNNLFHGGKFPEGPEKDVSRDRKLLEAGLSVMQAFLDADPAVRTAFLEGLE